MLGVLKRRWKPKSSSSGSKVPRSDTNSLDNCDRDKSSSNRIHQVHPVLDSQVFLGYEKSAAVRPETPPLTPQDNTNNCYQLTPNICVEAGRIQFIRQESEPARIDSSTGTKYPELDRNSISPLITVTRSVQTEEDDNRKIQTSLTNRIAELEAALEEAQKNELRDKQTITKLQKSLSRRESTQRDADRERRLRADSETRAKQALQEAARCRSRLKLLTHEFARMEETVRSMLTYKKQVEQYKQDKAVLSQTFENRCKQYQSTISRLNLEINTLRQQLETVSRESNTEDILQAQTTALQRHAEESRKQYERCLDDVANQVVRALLAQKDLKEEVGLLNNKIQELETQNRALTLMLIHQLHGDSPSTPLDLIITDEERNNKSRKTSPTSILCTNIKHCNSFNSEVLDESPKNEITYLNVPVDKRLSVDTSSIIDTRLSLEDKKRHQVLTKLWTELKGTEVTPKKLLEALSAVDSALWVPPKRPVSLNLQLQANKYKTGIVTNSNSGETNFKVEEEVTGNESPESGNRDEGYSTMSSDVQADVTRGSGDATTLPRRDLEDLKEASDETDVADNAKILVADNKDPDILYIPLNLLNLKQRNSFPPGKDILPFQHIMRSFSDSHLCIKITTTPTPCYTFSSPISSSPSFLLLDITEKAFNPLIMTKWNNGNFVCDDKTSQLSWSSTADERLECTTWDAEYIQRWLRLDETRSALQQQHRDMLELEYDRTELEDWSLSLSNDDLREHWKKMDATTPSQISISTLPSIQENNQLELEEDSNEYLWNNSSYMADKEGRELVTLLMDGTNSDKQQWPYSAPQQQISPDNSWSSGASDCFSHEPETCSKRSSAALSGSSDDTGEMPAIGTDFTRDFYRLVKFESTKSLASISSRSLGGGTTGCLSENGERVTTPSINVVQEKFSTTINDDDTTKEFNIEGPPQDFTELKISDSQYSINNKSDVKSSDSENYVTLKQLCEEFSMNNSKLAYADEICLVTPLDLETENCSNISERPVDICSSVNVEITSSSRDNHSKVEEKEEESNELYESISDISLSTNNCTSESLTSSLSTPDTVASKIPLRKTSKIPKTSTNQIYNNNNNNNNNSCKETKIPQSKKNSKSPKLMKIVHVQQPNSQVQHLITSERLPQCSSGIVSNIIDGPPHRAQSFHERATSKDVIDELNRMIKNGEETQTAVSNCTGENFTSPVKLDQACRPTGWVHVERDVDLTDPKARANLLDVMMASISSDSSPTSSCGGSVASDSTEDPPDYGQLHKIHKFHRQKKANAVRPEMAVVRASLPVQRPTIIGRPDFYVRYGDKEREAVASFDFLDDLSTTSSSLTCSMDEGLLLEDGSNLGRCKI